MLLLADKLDAIMEALKNCRIFENRNIIVVVHDVDELQFGEEIGSNKFVVLVNIFSSRVMEAEIEYESKDVEGIDEVAAAIRNLVGNIEINSFLVTKNCRTFVWRCPVCGGGWSGSTAPNHETCKICRL